MKMKIDDNEIIIPGGEAFKCKFKETTNVKMVVRVLAETSTNDKNSMMKAEVAA